MFPAETVSCLKARLTESLPGIAAHRIMAPFGRRERSAGSAPGHARRGAVLVLLYEGPHGLQLPLIVRADDGTAHGGQIGLPGGGYEEGDVYPEGTALRETEEEIRVAPDTVELVGCLSPLYVPVSNYYIVPVVGGYRGDPTAFRANPVEVERVVRVGCDDLERGRTAATVEARGRPMRVPAFVVDGMVVWGVTAMIISELTTVLAEACGEAALLRRRTSPDDLR